MKLINTAHRRPKTKRVVLTASLLACCFSSATFAQDDRENTDDNALEEVVVYGIKGALQSALQQKRNSDNLIEIVNAEDVGKLPDQNLAEVLENISGVQIDRNQGVGSTVSIRGSDQNRVEINGRGTTPAEDERGGVSFEDLPAELIAAVKVVKVPTADMVEGSLGGTVDLKTYRPLRVKKRIRVFNVRSEYAENRDAYTPSYSGTLSQKFDTAIGEMGFVVGGTYSSVDVREDNLNVRVGPRTNQDLDGDGINDPYLRPQFSQQFNSIADRENTAFNGSFEWQASDEIRLFVDATYTDAEIQNRGNYTALGLPGARAELDNLDTAEFRDYVAPNGVVIPIITRAQIDGLQIRSTNASASRFTDTLIYALGGEWTTGPWTVLAEYATSESDTFAPNFGLVTQFQNPDAANINSAGARQRVDFFYDATGPLEYGPVDPSQHDFLDTDAYAVFVARDRETYFDNEEDATKIDVTWDMDGVISSIQGGYREGSRSSARTALTLSSATWPGLAQDDLAPFLTSTPTDMMDFNSGGFYLDGFLTPNADLFTDPTAIRDAVGLPTDPDLDQTQSFRVKEDSFATYLLINFDMNLGSWPLRGNIGARYVITEQFANGFAIGPGFPDEGQPIVAYQKYKNTLPSFSFVLAPTDDFLIRLGGAKILRRPNFGDLSPTVRFPANNNAVTRGNPQLQPTTADQLDLSFEYYFRKGSLLSVGFFKKEIDGSIGSERLFDAIFNPNATDANGNQGSLVDVITPVNVAGGDIDGIEISLQHSFDHLAGWLGGFGTVLNYTYQDGSRDVTFNIPGFLRVDGEAIEFPLNFQQLSENSYNITVFYEREKWEARLRYTQRDGFLRDESKDISNGFPLYQTERGQLNGNFAYNITDNFMVTLSGINLTKERNDETAIFMDGPVVQMRDSDRRVVLGVRARF